MSRTYVHDNVFEGEVLPDGRVSLKIALSQANKLDHLELLVIARRYDLDIEAYGRDNINGLAKEVYIKDREIQDIFDISYDRETGEDYCRKSRFAEEGDDG